MTTLTLAADSHVPTVAILANPMSGRDVRRLAARASNTTHEGKRDMVARVAVGADAMGIKRILIMKEAFQIASGALEMLPLTATVEVIDVDARSSAADSVNFIRQCRLRGCDVMVTLGGDGTNRLVARTWPDACLVPLSTGTNNVFPVLVEATSAGQAAGLVATGRVRADQVAVRCKLIHVRGERFHDVAVIDALLLRNDHVGNYLPFDPAKMESLVLTRAEPASVGTSPIGGMLQPVTSADEHGLGMDFGAEGEALFAPLSPGLFRTVRVMSVDRLPFGSSRQWRGPAVIALDGDRERKLVVGEHAHVEVQRDGPWVVDVPGTLLRAAREGRFPDPVDDA